MDAKTQKMFLAAQRTELTASRIYRKVADAERNPENKKILLTMAAAEARHAETLRKYTGENAKPYAGRVWRFGVMARLLGTTFTIKRLEQDEDQAEKFYSECAEYPEIQQIANEEEAHEQQLIGMIDEERLAYMGSVVLGLNDALVEFTGALAGFTLALSSSALIALTGSITGIAAALSMASSEYLSTKSDASDGKHPVKAAVYTGIAYIITVTVLVMPFVLINKPVAALAVMLALALAIIAMFNYYYAVAKSEKFSHRFGEMAILSFSVAAISFLIGFALKTFTGIDA